MNNYSPTKLLLTALAGMFVVILYFLLKISSLEGSFSFPLAQLPNSTNLWVIALTGLTVGGLTCLAVQGGLLASVIAAREEEEVEKGINRRNTVFPTLAFLAAKLVAYTALGFFLGAFGGVIGISQSTQIIMQFVAGIYMIAVALNLLQVHPIFRYVVIQPPKFLTRRVRDQSKSKELFAPAFLGAMTIFIPCGTTLAMEALAMSSANAFLGAAIMAAFVLGTMPLFFGVGWLTAILGDNFRGRFLKVAAFAVLYLGVTSAIGALTASGISINFQNNSTSQTQISQYQGLPQEVNINITSRGYSPVNLTAKNSIPIKLNLKSEDAFSCASAFRIPQLGIAINLQPNQTKTIELPAQSKGQIAFTCSMGMYRGVINVL